ncbi:MAG TPA: O-antigen ligase family protein [Solirubrobacterales bacterium]
MRTAWRPSPYVWGALWILALIAVHELYPERLEGRGALATPILLLAGLLVARKLWELPPAVTMCGAMVLRIFSNAWGQVGVGGVPLDRLLFVFVLLQVFLRSPGAARMPPLRLRNVHLLLGLTILYLLASAAAAGTLSGESGGLPILDEFGVAPFLAFLLAPSVFSGRRERNLLLAVLVGLGLYLGLTAVFESVGPHALVFPHYIVAIDAADPAERVNGPFQSSVAEGCALFACAVAAAIAFAQWRGERRRWLAALAGAVCLFGCFATLERGVWIATLLGIVVASLATRTGRRRLLPGLLIAAVAIGGALAASPSLSEKASARAGYERSVWDRKNQTAAGLRMLAAKPLFGFGLGRYKDDSLEYFRQPRDYPMTGRVAIDSVGIPEVVQPLHNLYLGYAVELGLVGFSLWFASLLWGVGGAIFARGPAELRPWKLGLLAIAVFLLAVTAVNPNQPPFTSLLLWTWAGVATANVFSPAPGGLRDEAPRRTAQAWRPARLKPVPGT